MKLFFTFLLVFPLFSIAQDTSCRPVNLLLEKKWGRAALLKLGKKTTWDHPIKQMPLYNQGQTGICYAYSAIQLLDYWRQTKGLRITKNIALSSPVYAALLTRTYKKSKYFGQEDIEGGHIDLALNTIRAKGMCRDDVIQNALNKFALIESKNYNIDQRELLEMIYLLIPYMDDPQKIKSMSEKQIWDQYINGKMRMYYKRAINNEGNIAKLYKKVAKTMLKGGKVTSLLNSIFKECQKPTSIYIGTKRIPNPKEVKLRKGNKVHAQKLIRQLLNSKNAQPIGVGYCSNLLKHKNYVGSMVHKNPNYGGQIITKNKKTCGNHASIIVGKKEIDGKCHYLIRNTWGTKCDYDWPCKLNANKEAVGIYVSEEQLFRNVMSFTYLGSRDLYCRAQMGKQAEFFELDYPDMNLSYRQDVTLFNDGIQLIFKALNDQGDDMTKILVGKSLRELYVLDHFERNDRKIENFTAKYSNKKIKNLLINCIKNDAPISKLKAKLKTPRLPQKQLFCKAYMGSKNQTFQIDIPDPKNHKRQDVLLFNNKLMLLFMMKKKGKKDITKILIGPSLKKLFTLESFPKDDSKMSSFSGKFDYKNIKNFNVSCSKNKNYRTF